MGESLVETTKVEYKMGDTVTNLSCLQQSVSFGRFERDSLCWERWSAFPTNKYLEEVEKCSTPGSVAKKKAYFEAHYKNVAARRAELLQDQQREREDELVVQDSAATNSINNASKEESDNKKSDMEESPNKIVQWENKVVVEHVPVKSDSDCVFNRENEVGNIDGHGSVECAHLKSDIAFNQESEASDSSSENRGPTDGILTLHDECELSNFTSVNFGNGDGFKGDHNIIHEVNEVERIVVTKDTGELYDGDVAIDEVVKKEVIEHIAEPDERANMIERSDERPLDEIARDDLSLTLKISESGQSEEPVSVIDDVACIGDDELPQEKVKKTITEEENKTVASQKNILKATLMQKTASTATAKNIRATPISKRLTAAMPKSPMLSTPKTSKPDLTKFTKSANRLLDKKEHGFTPTTSKKSVGPHSKRVAPTSLHMSLSLGPMNSDQLSRTRKSLIMENMGDKDVVKRAFKAFQNTPQMSPSSLTKSPAINKSVSRKAEPKGSLANVLPAKHDGSEKAKTASAYTGQQGIRKSVVSPGVKKNGVAEQTKVKSVTASFGPRVQLAGNKQKEVSKNLDLKPGTNAVKATNVQSKLKVEKASKVKNPSQSINSKPKFPSSSNRGAGRFAHKENGTSRIQSSG